MQEIITIFLPHTPDFILKPWLTYFHSVLVIKDTASLSEGTSVYTGSEWPHSRPAVTERGKAPCYVQMGQNTLAGSLSSKAFMEFESGCVAVTQIYSLSDFIRNELFPGETELGY